MDPHDGDQECRLEGDQDEITYTDAEGDLRCRPHHDDWVDNTWFNMDGVNRGRSIVYRDVTRPTPVPNVPWLLMEPITHESRRRTWVCFLKNPSSVKLQNMHVCDKLCMLVLGVCF